MEYPNDDILRKKFMEFPYVSSATHRRLMVDLMSTLENSIGSLLLQCSLPQDVQNFKYSNDSISTEASLRLRSGKISSPIDFVMGSWIHMKNPTASEYFNITTIYGNLNSSTKAPNFVFKLIHKNPTSLILILDLPHRKDLLLHPDYLKTFYLDTHLDSLRKSLLNLPEIKPSLFPSVYIRSAFSPTAVMLEINAENERKLDEILRVHVVPAAKAFLSVWLERCVREDDEIRVTNEGEKMELERRDKIFKKWSIVSDFDYPKLFGEEVRSRVLQPIKEAVGVL